MGDEVLSLEQRLILAYLFKHGPTSVRQLAEAFAKFAGPDRVPYDLTVAGYVSAFVEDLWYENLVEPTLRRQTESGLYDLTRAVRACMQLGGIVEVHGVLGVLHG